MKQKIIPVTTFYDFFVPNFSTTTPVQTTVYQITLLESYKKKFSYVGETGCGIPQITITGNKEDWIWIFDHLSDLDKLGLTWWGKELRPIIKEFINVSMTKSMFHSGIPYIKMPQNTEHSIYRAGLSSFFHIYRQRERIF